MAPKASVAPKARAKASALQSKGVAVSGRAGLPAAPSVARGCPRPAPGPARGGGAWGGSGEVGAIRQLQDMGFSAEVARQALSQHMWDVNGALDYLLTHGGLPPASAELRAPPGAAPVTPKGRAEVALTPREAGTEASTTASSPPSAALTPRDEEVEAVDLPAVSTTSSRDGALSSPDAEAAAGATECVAATSRTSAEPAADAGSHRATRQLQRADQAWEAADSPAGSLSSIAKGDFIYAWEHTRTDHGWIYADHIESGLGGWVPASVLQPCAQGRRWMVALQSCEASHETQVQIVKGSTLLVAAEWRTDEGWVYAEEVVGTDGKSKGEVQGWVPVNCLDWPEDC